MKEPISVFTNLAYVVAGALLVLQAPLVGTSLVVLGLASAWYHWRLSKYSQLTDERGIYLAFACLSHLAWISTVPWLAWSSLALGAFLVIKADKVDSFVWSPILVLYMLLGLSISLGSWHTGTWLLAGYTCTALIRQSHDSVFPQYRDLIHGVWHLGTAVYMYITADLLLQNIS